MNDQRQGLPELAKLCVQLVNVLSSLSAFAQVGRFRHRKVQFIQGIDLHLQQLHDLGAEFLESLQRRTLHHTDGRK